MTTNRFEILRRKVFRNARPAEKEESPEFRTELREFDPEVYSQNPLADDLDLEISDPGGDA